MEKIQSFRPSLRGLLKALTSDTKTLLRQEVQLAKTEITEKVAKMGRNSVIVAVGGFVAYAGAIVLLIGIGWVIGWGLEAAGLSQGLARALGLIAIGLIVAASGYVMLRKGLKTLTSEPLAPQRTIQTIQDLKGGPEPASPAQPKEKLSSQQLQERVEATETRMGDTLDELGHRLSPKVINQQVKDRISANPYRAGGIAMALGVLSGFLLRHKFLRSWGKRPSVPV